MSPNYSRPAAGVVARGLQILSVLGVLSLLILIVSVQRLCAQVHAEALTSQGQHLRISATLSPATIGVAYEAVILVSGGTAPYRFKSKNLPSGLVLNQTTGEISGTPQVAGQFQFAGWVRDSAGDQGLSQFTLTVNNLANIEIAISPSSTTLNSGATAQFQATVTNTSNTSVTWTASAGTVSSSGLFTAPTVKSNTSVVLTATSVADTTKSASASISVVTTVVSGGVSMEVVLFPGQQGGVDSAAIKQYLMNNTQVALGATLVVQWGAVDKDGNPSDYDWSYVDSEILPWENAGKKVNLELWANSDGSGATCGSPR